MNYPAAELRGIKMIFYPINPDAEHRGILLIKKWISTYMRFWFQNTDECKLYFKTIAVYCENVHESSLLLIHVHSLTVRGPTIDLEKAIIE